MRKAAQKPAWLRAESMPADDLLELVILTCCEAGSFKPLSTVGLFADFFFIGSILPINADLRETRANMDTL
jgi:hypothetical protein